MLSAARRTGAAPARPHVMQVVLSLAPGGTEHLVVEMCRRLPPRFDVSVCCLDDEGAWAPGLRARGVEVIALHRQAGFRPGIGRAIARLAAERSVSLLHCHQYSPFVYGVIAARWNRRLKMVYTEHGRLSDAPPSMKRKLVNPLLSASGGAIVAVSEELRQYMIASCFPASRVSVVRNGIPPLAMATGLDRIRARRALGLDGEALVFMTVARLDPVKDLQTLLEAFAVVRRGQPAARLVIVGDGPERQALAARARHGDLAGAVDFTGYTSEVRGLLPAADVYVSSSISEGISITILEAMAAGIPIVATAVGGTPEILAGSRGGILVPSRDPDGLATAMLWLAGDAARRDAMGAAARVRLTEAFTMERMIDDYAATYRGLMNG
jgi:glycosyltransferase involved in cell wall biosynthesis